MTKKNNEPSVQERLIEAALDCFLNDEYHKVSTRQIAARADTNIGMIRYYFGSKEGLYEEMIRSKLDPLLDVLESSLKAATGGFSDYFRIYYQTMLENPRFPHLILKVLALKQGPGRRFIYQLLERGRSQGRESVERLKKVGSMDKDTNPDVVRIAFVSMAMMPMLLKEVFEEQMEQELDETFFDSLAQLDGSMFASVFMPKQTT
jgi:AcrR family transcriptional regulator